MNVRLLCTGTGLRVCLCIYFIKSVGPSLCNPFFSPDVVGIFCQLINQLLQLRAESDICQVQRSWLVTIGLGERIIWQSDCFDARWWFIHGDMIAKS